MSEAGEMPQQEVGDRRGTKRIAKLFYVRLEGREGSVLGLIRNLSPGGALVTLADPGFVEMLLDGDRPQARDHITSLFGSGLQIRFRQIPVKLPAEVVRVEVPRDVRTGRFRLGVHFRRDLRPAEAALLGVDCSGAAERAVRESSEADGAPAAAAPESPDEPPGHTRVRLTYSGPERSMDDVLALCRERGATDLHLKSDSAARLRIDGELVRLGNRSLGDDEVRGLVTGLLTPDQLARFAEDGDLDFAYELDGQARFRVNVYVSCGRLCLAARLIPETVPSCDELGLAPACRLLAERRRGLVLVTGPTGSGKSTTLAAMVDHVNRHRSCHIVTMEDPVEYRHREKEAMISQREVGRDTPDFASALRRALRQDPDVLMVGEMRDLETISLAVTAAETGHLVFGTLHTTSAVQSIARIVDVFPAGQQAQIRMQLADSLEGVVSQVLVPRVGGGLAVAQEVLVATGAIRSQIREAKSAQIENMMQTGAQTGMQTLDTSLLALVRDGVIEEATALSYARRPERIGSGERRRRPREDAGAPAEG